MKITYSETQFNQAGFFPVPAEQDAYPMTSGLFTSLTPTWFSGARKGLACALAYLTSVSGLLSFNSKISPLTASLLQGLFPSREILVDTGCVEFKPLDMQLGQATMHVGIFNRPIDAVQFNSELNDSNRFDETSLAIVKNDGISGFLSMPRHRLVTSNFWMSKELEMPFDSFLKACSLALMYSEDLVANRIVLHYPNSGVGFDEMKIISDLFYSVGLTLEVC